MGSWYLDLCRTLNHHALQIGGFGNGHDPLEGLNHADILKTKAKHSWALGNRWIGRCETVVPGLESTVCAMSTRDRGLY